MYVLAWGSSLSEFDIFLATCRIWYNLPRAGTSAYPAIGSEPLGRSHPEVAFASRAWATVHPPPFPKCWSHLMAICPKINKKHLVSVIYSWKIQNVDLVSDLVLNQIWCGGCSLLEGRGGRGGGCFSILRYWAFLLLHNTMPSMAKGRWLVQCRTLNISSPRYVRWPWCFLLHGSSFSQHLFLHCDRGRQPQHIAYLLFSKPAFDYPHYCLYRFPLWFCCKAKSARRITW